MSTTMPGPHLTDAEVIRSADEQLEPGEQERVTAHLATCDVCRAQRERAQHRKEKLSALLLASDFDTPVMRAPAHTAAIDITAPRARRTPPLRWFPAQPWLRAAAGIVLLLGVALSIAPVRAAIVSWVRAQLGGREVVQPAAPPRTAPTPAAPLGPRIQFVHQGGTFRLEFAAPDPAGTLNVRRTQDARVSAEASSPDLDLLVLTSGLRVTNATARSVTYNLELPATVTAIVVVVQGREVVRLSGSQVDAGVVLGVR